MSTEGTYRLLLADNTPEVLVLNGEYLRRAGFEVLTADSVTEARHILRTQRVHLAVLDMRLERDEDEKDQSGYLLAKSEARTVPKIILTANPNVADAVSSLKRDTGPLPPAVEYLSKPETTLQDLLTTVQQSLADYVRLNWQLRIIWPEGGTMAGFRALAGRVNREAEPAALAEQAAEAEDLFRQLFYDFTQINIGHPLATAGSRLILPVYAFDAHGVETRFIVTFGPLAAVAEEKARCEQWLPAAYSLRHLGKTSMAETVHFGAWAHTFMGMALSQTAPFRERYPALADTEISAVLRSLYRENLHQWYVLGRGPDDPDRTAWLPFVQAWLSLPPLAELATAVQARIEEMLPYSRLPGLLNVEASATHLFYNLESGQTVTLPHPASFLAQGGLADAGEVDWGVVHGQVTADTVFVDGGGKAWLGDFARVDRAPLLIDFVSLETAVKFDLLPEAGCARLLALQEALAAGLFMEAAAASEAVPTVARAVHTVAGIRQQAASLAGCDGRAYQAALLLYDLALCLSFAPSLFYPAHRRLVFFHALLEAAMLTQALAETAPPDVPEAAHIGFWLDTVNKNAWVEGRLVNLTRQEFALLDFLNRHPNQLCERQAIVEDGLGEPYDPFDKEQSRLNSAMSRLRRKLEPDPANPRYLITDHGLGYRLQVGEHGRE